MWAGFVQAMSYCPARFSDQEEFYCKLKSYNNIVFWLTTPFEIESNGSRFVSYSRAG